MDIRKGVSSLWTLVGIVALSSAILVLGMCKPATAADHQLDTSYHFNGWSAADVASGGDTAYGVALQPDGRVVEVGSSSNGSDLDFAVIRRAANGNADMTLGGDGKVFVDFGSGNDVAHDVEVEPGGDIIVVGGVTYQGKVSFGIARLALTDGAVLGTQVVAFTYASEANAVALQTDGKIVLAGRTFNGVDMDIALVRLNRNLSIDTSFSGDGIYTVSTSGDVQLWDVAMEADGRIIVAGSGYSIDRVRFFVQRFAATGAPGSAFFHAFDDDAEAHAVAVQKDGKIVLAGSCESNHGDTAVLRLQQNLALDTGFNGDGKHVHAFTFGRDEAWDVAVQADGRIVVAGWLTRDGGLQEVALLRYTTDGTPDPSFNSAGYASASYGGWDTRGRALDLQPDGKYVVAGYATPVSDNLFVTARFMGDENQIFADGLEWSTTEPWSGVVP